MAFGDTRRSFLVTLLGAGTGILASGSAQDSVPTKEVGTVRDLAARILADSELNEVVSRAKRLLSDGLNAGDGYGEVWIRDLNTFIELALQGGNRPDIREALLTFFRFQGPAGDIPDGYIPEAKASVGYKYRRSEFAPGLLAHKNTVETDQETSLVQAVARYVRVTGDAAILDERVGGTRVRERLAAALEYLTKDRWDAQHGLVWGATTVDWGDVQPEHAWGVELDEDSHKALDIYDNAMFLVAIDDLLSLPRGTGTALDLSVWRQRRESLRAGVRRHLWDSKRGKFVPHVYLAGSPFPPEFNEGEIWYHGGTAVAMEAGLLDAEEIRAALAAMRENVRRAGAASIGLTVYPPYPDGFFKNPSMGAWSYQNGGDWSWFGGRLVRQLTRWGMPGEAYAELKPMVSRVLRHNGFYEWWTRQNEPRGSGKYRGSAGVLGIAILELQAWARRQLGSPTQP